MSPQILATSQTRPIPPFVVAATLPADSPLTALAGRTVTLPVATVEDLVRRVAEARQAGAKPTLIRR